MILMLILVLEILWTDTQNPKSWCFDYKWRDWYKTTVWAHNVIFENSTDLYKGSCEELL